MKLYIVLYILAFLVILFPGSFGVFYLVRALKRVRRIYRSRSIYKSGMDEAWIKEMKEKGEFPWHISGSGLLRK
ncbi:MAG: hypothetical protein ABL917_03700 [Parcubacteria group bacterium]